MSVTIQEGKFLDYTAGGSAIAAGDVVVIGSLVGVAPRPIAANSTGVVQVEGVVSMAKPSAGANAETIAAGATVYWYAASGVANVANATGVKAGYSVAQAVTGATTVSVKLER